MRDWRQPGEGNSPTVEVDRDGQLARAIEVLRDGGVVAIPTDTLYGLAACALDVDAVNRVFEIKGRHRGASLPLLLADPDDLSLYASSVPSAARKLAERFWPGPLTIVLPRADRVPEVVTGGGSTVALRVPDHPVPRHLARSLGMPITGTSANLTGAEPLRSAAEVERQLGDRLDMVFDGGTLPESHPSTVVDLSASPPRLVRAGAISRRELGEVAGVRIQ
jgi:L-threonylcarbamoyladenylate synthase